MLRAGLDRLHRRDRLQVRRRPHQGGRACHRRLLRAARSRSTRPVNIHLTGCHNSCAQHYIGDIGLIGAKIPVNEEGDTVPGYHVFVGGGFGVEGGIGRELRTNVKAEDAPALVEAHPAQLADASRHAGGELRRLRPPARDHGLQTLVEQTGEAA